MAVAEELHFGRAAARLYISQPSLSQQIRKLEETLGVQLFRRTSREVHLTAAGRVLLDQAPPALAALEVVAERTRQAGAGAAATLRLGYTPVASFDTLPTLIAAAERDCPDVTVIAAEHFSAGIAERLLAGDLDVGLALHPHAHAGVDRALLRVEPVTALLGKGHALAGAGPIGLGELEDAVLLLFPRELAPDYYDRIVAACESIGFSPRVRTFADPPVTAMIARLAGGREIGLAPASFAIHAADASPDLIAREVVGPAIKAELSILWPARDTPAAVYHFLASTRACATARSWLPHS